MCEAQKICFFHTIPFRIVYFCSIEIHFAIRIQEWQTELIFAGLHVNSNGTRTGKAGLGKKDCLCVLPDI
ncbi:hypothetical protein HMPREF0240_02875 [Clostridium sp. D5]|nr:hypothetical protein HMPREF0240_02875 [Clostridium sp. D5]